MKHTFVHIKDESGVVTQRQVSTLGSPEKGIVKLVESNRELEGCFFRLARGKEVGRWENYGWYISKVFLFDKPDATPDQKEPRDPFMLAGIRQLRRTAHRQNSGSLA